jgi:5-methylcytosine-specific restriction enzyme subunit McrC
LASYTTFEFSYLVAAADSRKVSIAIGIQSFDWLKGQYLADNGKYRQLFRFCSIGGAEALQLRNYVGVISTPFGDQIEVLPKIGRRNVLGSAKDIQQEARASLLNMMRHLHTFRNIESRESLVESANMPLLEVFIRQFLLSVDTLVKRGLRSDYSRVEENQTFLKGRLLVNQQLRHNLVNQHRFYVEYDEFLPDRPVNRIIHTALVKVASLCRSEANERLCRELRFSFAVIPVSRNIRNDLSAMRMDRGMELYEKPIAWARLILNEDSPLAMEGKAGALSLLFPMEAVFESYVADILRQQLKASLYLREQVQSKTLVSHGDNHWFRLKPDIVLYDHDDKPCVVMDTKWKLLDTQQDNGSRKYDISQSDMYQMFAYGQKYLGGKGTLVLIYPKSETFQESIKLPFVFSDDGEAKLELYVVPFDVSSDMKDCERITLPIALFKQETTRSM